MFAVSTAIPVLGTQQVLNKVVAQHKFQTPGVSAQCGERVWEAGEQLALAGHPRVSECKLVGD